MAKIFSLKRGFVESQSVVSHDNALFKYIPDFTKSFQTFVCYANLVDFGKYSHLNNALKKTEQI